MTNIYELKITVEAADENEAWGCIFDDPMLYLRSGKMIETKSNIYDEEDEDE